MAVAPADVVPAPAPAPAAGVLASAVGVLASAAGVLASDAAGVVASAACAGLPVPAAASEPAGAVPASGGAVDPVSAAPVPVVPAPVVPAPVVGILPVPELFWRIPACCGAVAWAEPLSICEIVPCCSAAPAACASGLRTLAAADAFDGRRDVEIGGRREIHRRRQIEPQIDIGV